MDQSKLENDKEIAKLSGNLKQLAMEHEQKIEQLNSEMIDLKSGSDLALSSKLALQKQTEAHSQLSSSTIASLELKVSTLSSEKATLSSDLKSLTEKLTGLEEILTDNQQESMND